MKEEFQTEVGEPVRFIVNTSGDRYAPVEAFRHTQMIARSIGKIQGRLSDLKRRIRKTVALFPEHGEQELHMIQLKRIDDSLEVARDKLVRGNLVESEKYIAAAEGLLLDGENKVDRFIQSTDQSSVK